MKRITNRAGRPSFAVLDAAADGLSFEDIETVVREVVTQVAAPELDVFTQVRDDFRRDPAALMRAGRRESVAMGIDLTPLAATTWLVGGALGGLLVEIGRGVLSDALSEPTRQMLQGLFRRRSNGRHANGRDRPTRLDLTASPSTDAFTELVSPSGSPAPTPPVSVTDVRASPRLEVTTIRLSPEQEAEIHRFILALTAPSGLAPDDVDRVVHSFLIVLQSRAHP